MVLSTIILSIALLYTWLYYPFILRLFSPGSPSSSHPHAPTLPLPPVTVILAAYNEESHIRARLENTLALDYPPDRIAVHLGLDGCTDNTTAIARSLADSNPNIHVHDFPERRGKVAVLKALIYLFDDMIVQKQRNLPESSSHPIIQSSCPPPILVFTDANTHFRPDALRQLVSHFEDPDVGGVCGRLIFKPPNTPTLQHSNIPIPPSPEGSYWDWETKLKVAESALDSCIGANGAIYAMRAELFWREIPNNTLIDDFVFGVKVREQGFRMVYEPNAVAEEDLPDVADEWTRRVRIGAGAYQALSLCRRALLPLPLESPSPHESPNHRITESSLSFPWMFWSHKVLRWFTPHMLLALLILSISSTLSSALHCAQFSNTPTLQHSITPLLQSLPLLFFLAGGIARLLRNTNWANLSLLRPLRLLDHFLTMQAALFAGFLRYCRGGLKGQWTRTPRNR